MSDTDTITAALAGLRCRERELELEAVAVRARVAEVRDMIERLEPPRRRVGRPRNVSALNPYPSQQAQQAHNTANFQMPDADLPSLDDVQGILKPEESAA